MEEHGGTSKPSQPEINNNPLDELLDMVPPAFLPKLRLTSTYAVSKAFSRRVEERIEAFNERHPGMPPL